MKDIEITFYCEDCDIEFKEMLSNCTWYISDVGDVCPVCGNSVYVEKDEWL
jgi:hypothetical protein